MKNHELAGALRYEKLTGRQLLQGPDGGIDFYYEIGQKKVWVEHMGSVGDLGKPTDFAKSIYKHVVKSTDELIIDVTNMAVENYAKYDEQLEKAVKYLMKENRIVPTITWIGRK